MRIVALLTLGALIFGCNSEATVCPNPSVCGGGPLLDSGSETDAADAAADSAVEAEAEAAIDSDAD